MAWRPPLPDLGARLRSLRRRGPRRGLQTAVSIVEDVLFDRRHGVETRQRVEPGAAGPVLGEHAAHGRACHSTRVRHFRTLMATLALPPGLGFLDYGAGKGRVLMLAAGYPFTRVVGVEYAPALCQQAERNLDRFRASSGCVTAIQLVQADAAGFEVDPDLHVFYLANPFDEVVQGRVLERVRASLRRHPRPAWLIGNKTRLDGLVEAAGMFRLHLRLSYGNADFHAWHHPG